jgi:Flp pilus assembly protein TadD
MNVEQTVERARAAWAAGRADEAEMACRQVLAVWPGQTDAAYLLGLMAHTYGNLDLAIAHVREACRSPARAGGLLQRFRRDVPAEGPAGRR